MRKPDLSAEELLVQYEAGRRDFSYLSLRGISLPHAVLEGASFRHSSLVGADLTQASLSSVDFTVADLDDARLVGASLFEADLGRATLRAANLRDAYLAGASLELADCTAVEMDGAYLGGSIFMQTILTDLSVGDASIGSTSFADVDVGPLCEASFLEHDNRSYIDPRTVMKSYKHPRLKSFMVDCGVPEVFAEYMIDCAKALGDDLLHELMQSTFISYGGPDEPFARRLYDAMRAHGVVTFFFPETARVGERIGDEVFNALQRHDRMILVCSRASLDRRGVLNEIQETLDREARDGGATYLIPVMLDDYLLTDWKEAQPELAERVGRRVAADFSGAASDSAKFDAALSRLLAALRKKGPGYSSPV